MMKRFVSLSVFAMLVFGSVEAQEIAWLDPIQLETAMKKEPKKIFVDLTAKWCGWCKVMDKKTFSKEEVYSYMNENYYALKLDVDENKPFDFFGKTYSAKMLVQQQGISGLPGFLFMSEDAQIIVPSMGYQKPADLLRKLKRFNE